MIFAHLKTSFRETFPARASEWALSGMLMGWSVILTINEDLFATGASYAKMAELADQETWATLCLYAAALRLLMLLVNGAWRRSPHLRALGAFIACGFWFQITIGFIQAGTVSTGLAVYPFLLLLDSYNAVRAAGEAGLSDKVHKRAGHGIHK
ncbi:hypothetical protein [Aliihoeflea sp. 40Bstr573]|uniref:hypothetical protein n=1 Tax=Aliihoeflea sp. 40Bstr573 TaxID=2696467 RepID=UPI0020956305|nr:hypothetical protein [Aliihoeflea sp. 40Bstr573]MCO6386255.1 hypothetical protein [Aliihoeflea sp. 40Bstr573]